MEAADMPDRNGIQRARGSCARRIACALVFAPAIVLGPASAPAHADRPHDHDRAREALEAGEILPLSTILQRVERENPGQVLDVELEREREHGEMRWVYRIKLLRPGGTRARLEVDARDGRVIASRTRERKTD